MQIEKNYSPVQPEMICWINKTETNLQHVWRNQQYVVFAKFHHDQLCQRLFEDQSESCQSSNSYQSPFHSIRKGKNL